MAPAHDARMDIEQLLTYKANRLLKCQKHPDKDLHVWNYADVVQLKGLWDEITSRARALVTDSKGNIVAHSFRKFHNIENNLHTPTPEFSVYEKLDGSLILLFWYDNEWVICSRGSFMSPQAIAARSMLSSYDVTGLDPGLAYTFEIIYPENRIVVNYQARKELVFLAAFRKNGEEAFPVTAQVEACGFPVAKSFAFDDYQNIQGLDWENSEGFVVRFTNGERVKIKFHNYVQLHRIASNMNALRIWELFCAGKPLDEVVYGIPDEFLPWVEQTWGAMQKQSDDVWEEVVTFFSDLKSRTSTRAEFAKVAAKHPRSVLLFQLYEEKPETQIRARIAHALRPVDGLHQVPFGGAAEA